MHFTYPLPAPRVRGTSCQLTTQGKVAAPSCPAIGHLNLRAGAGCRMKRCAGLELVTGAHLHLVRHGQGEELACRVLQLHADSLQWQVSDASVEEARVAARGPHLRRDPRKRGTGRITTLHVQDQRRHVNDGQAAQTSSMDGSNILNYREVHARLLTSRVIERRVISCFRLIGGPGYALIQLSCHAHDERRSRFGRHGRIAVFAFPVRRGGGGGSEGYVCPESMRRVRESLDALFHAPPPTMPPCHATPSPHPLPTGALQVGPRQWWWLCGDVHTVRSHRLHRVHIRQRQHLRIHIPTNPHKHAGMLPVDNVHEAQRALPALPVFEFACARTRARSRPTCWLVIPKVALNADSASASALLVRLAACARAVASTGGGGGGMGCTGAG